MSKINSYARPSSFFFYLDKVIKNSTLGEISYIWQIERDQIDAIKFERTQINILSDVLRWLPSSPLLLELPNGLKRKGLSLMD